MVQLLESFRGSDVHITYSGKRYFGAALGSQTFVEESVKEEVAKWKDELTCLSSFAVTEHHAAFAAFTHGFMAEWVFLLRTIGNITPLMQPLEETIQLEFMLSLTGRSTPTDEERDLLALLASFGGLGLINPTTLTHKYANSKRLSNPLSNTHCIPICLFGQCH